jgi:hypothetical protein
MRRIYLDPEAAEQAPSIGGTVGMNQPDRVFEAAEDLPLGRVEEGRSRGGEK